MEEEKEKLKHFSTDALIGLLVRAGADVEVVVTLDKDQLVDFCLVAKGLKEGVLPKKVVKDVSMVEIMQIMRQEQMERENKMRREQKEREEKEMEREEKMRKEKMEMEEKQMVREERMRKELMEMEEKQMEREERMRKEQMEWQKEMLSRQAQGQEMVRDEAVKERERKMKEEESSGSKIKKFGDILKNVLPNMPSEDVELPLYLESVESLFNLYQVPDDLKCALLMPFLSEKAKRLVRRLPAIQMNTYVNLKAALLREFRLTPQQYRAQFVKAEKVASESWMQFATRLRTYLRFYLESRGADTLQKLQDLWVADRMKECMSFGVRSHIVAKEGDGWFDPIRLAELTDIFSINMSENSNFRDTYSRSPSKFGERRSSQNGQGDLKEFDKKPSLSKYNPNGVGDVQRKSDKPKCFLCSSDQHFKVNCPRNREKPKTPLAKVSHVLAESEEREINVGHVKVEQDKDEDWFEREGFCNPCDMKYGPYDYFRESELIGERESEIRRGRMEKKKEDEIDVDLISLFALNALNVAAENVSAVNTGVTLSCIPRVRLQIGNVLCNALLDSGTEITVVNKRMLPEIFQDSQPIGKVKLRGAFGVQSEAEIMNLPCALISDKGQSKVSILVTCAVTDELMLDTECLLTLDDYKALRQSQTLYDSELQTGERQTTEVEVTTEPELLFIGGLNNGEVRKVLQVKDRSNTETSMVERCEEELPTWNHPSESIAEERIVVLDESDDTHQLVQTAEQMRKEQMADEELMECWSKGEKGEDGFYIRAVDKLLFHKDNIGREVVQQVVMPKTKDIAEEHAASAQERYAHYYNLRSKDKTFGVGDQVVILERDHTDKLSAGWIGPGTIAKKVSAYSYLVQLPDGSERTLHANYLRQFNPRVSTVGIICEGEEDFGQVECQPGNDSTEMTDKINALDQIDLGHLNLEQQLELRAVLKKFALLFDDKPGLCKIGTHSIRLQGDVCPRRQK